MPPRIDLHEFFVSGNDSERLHVLLHVSEPSTARELAHGYFFAVIEVDHGTTETIEACQELISTLEKQYYTLPTDGEKHPFELAVEYVNRRSHHLILDRKVRLSIVVGAISGQSLLFATHGEHAIHLLYSKNDELEDITLGDADTSGTQLFPAIMQGEVGKGDILYAVTPRTADYIPPERMKKMLAKKPPRVAAANIQETLENMDSGLGFGGVLLQMEETLGNKGVGAPVTDDGIEEPEEVEMMSRPQKRTRDVPPRGDILSGFGVAMARIVVGFAKLIKGLLIGTGKLLFGGVLIITNWGGQRESVLESMSRTVEEKRQYLLNLPITTKILAIVMILLLAIFAGTVFVNRIRAEREQVAQTYLDTVQAITDKITAAEASAIYNDKAKALALIGEADTMAQNLPDDPGEKKAKRTELLERVAAQRERLRNVTKVSPTLVAKLTTDRPETNVTLLARLQNTLIAYGPNDTALHMVDMSSKAITRKDIGVVKGLKKHYVPKEGENILFIAENNRLANYDKESGTVALVEIASGAPEKSLVDVAVYNQRLYALDTETNQIYRHNKTQAGYDKGTTWVKQLNEPLTNANSFTIDGDIFIMETTGKIRKFSAGIEQAFSLQDVDPVLSGSGLIWTYTDLSNIYVLDTKNARVVVLDKNGVMKAQYVADAWKEPTGMVVDETKRTIYVLENNTVSMFSF